MRLETQLSNGTWVAIESDRAEQALTRADGCKQKRGDEWVAITRDEMMEVLKRGGTLTMGVDWYDKLRDGEACERILAERRASAPPVEMVKCSCGCTIPRESVMSASLGSSCPKCYDRMSA